MSPSHRFLLGCFLLVCWAMLGWLLVSGGQGLMQPVLGIPRGNLVAMGMLAAPALALMAFGGGTTRFRNILLGTTVAALLWFPLSWALAGNPRLVFRGDTRFIVWLAFTAVVMGMNAVLLAWRAFTALKRRLQVQR